MAVLGVEGYVRFRREAPAPIVVPVSALRSDTDTLQVSSTEFWNGDEVYLVAPEGLPLSADALPNGVGCYFGSIWELGPNRTHVTDETDEYYVSDDDTVYFYNRGTPVNSGTYFIYRDQLGRLSLYTTRAAALSGSTSDRIDLKQLDFQYVLIAPAGTEEYNNALAECLAATGDYRFSDIRDESTLASICDYAPDYLQPTAGTTEYDDAEIEPRRWVGGFPWIIQGELREWSIELNAENVDTTAVGQKFGESVKSVVSGGGSFDFLVERRTDENKYDSTSLMQLLLLTERGAKAEAEFFMITDRPANACGTLAPGDLYYSCELLVTNTAINTRATEAIVGTARFVTTGPIELKMGV
jgi:hypothetical protein